MGMKSKSDPSEGLVCISRHLADTHLDVGLLD